MRFDVVTLFPEMFDKLISQGGVISRAFSLDLVDLVLWNPRDYTRDVHRTVDDRPYGGGPGMVMKLEPLSMALKDAMHANPRAKVSYLSPQGRRIDQEIVKALARKEGMILIAGRYEGIDERVIERYVDEEWSIGDYVLSGGELPAMVLMDAVTRLIPGVLGDDESAQQDSFMKGLLDCPHYTRPEVIDGASVPNVLLSGDHEAVRRWRLQQSLGRTWLRRPDLLAERVLTQEEKLLLDEYKQAYTNAVF